MALIQYLCTFHTCLFIYKNKPSMIVASFVFNICITYMRFTSLCDANYSTRLMRVQKMLYTSESVLSVLQAELFVSESVLSVQPVRQYASESVLSVHYVVFATNQYFPTSIRGTYFFRLKYFYLKHYFLRYHILK
jgi:hypothetical protein